MKSVVKNLDLRGRRNHRQGHGRELTGTNFVCRQSGLPELEETQIYHVDLIGLGVQDTLGQQLGTVVGLMILGR